MHLSLVPVSVFAIAEAVGGAAVDIASVKTSVFGSDVGVEKISLWKGLTTGFAYMEWSTDRGFWSRKFQKIIEIQKLVERNVRIWQGGRS
jgi:hypothetical protein